MGKPYRPKDHYFQRAKQRGFRARSAFKLEELVQRFGLLRPGARVLDLGAAPGGFLQVIARAVGPSGLAVGVDLVPLRPFTGGVGPDGGGGRAGRRRAGAGGGGGARARTTRCSRTWRRRPPGCAATDEARSLRLAERALELARALGKPGSSFVAKLFMGGDFEAFRAQLREAYREVKVVRPEATRSASVEIYLVGLGLGAVPRARVGPQVRVPSTR